LRHTAVEAWSRGVSPVHRRAALAKMIPALVFLVTLATAHRSLALLSACYALLLMAAIWLARLPLPGILARAAVVLPFSGSVALISWLANDSQRALELIQKSYLSALAVLLLAATTPLAELLAGLEAVRVPVFLLTVIQFLYRYLFLIPEEAARMRTAAASRGGMTFQAASGALAVLFIRSYQRAGEIHRAMLARGFTGRLPHAPARRFSPADAGFLLLAIALPLAFRAAVERVG
jgi:cobalt/nickel transport system permease protein